MSSNCLCYTSHFASPLLHHMLLQLFLPPNAQRPGWDFNYVCHFNDSILFISVVCLAVGNCSAYLQARSVPNISAEKVNFLKKVQCSCKENDSGVLEPLVCCPANGQDYLYPSLKFSKFEYRRFQNVTAQFKRKKLKRRIQTVEPGESFNLRNECGKQVTNRIYGGEIAELDEFPWLALLVYSSSMI